MVRSSTSRPSSAEMASPAITPRNSPDQIADARARNEATENDDDAVSIQADMEKAIVALNFHKMLRSNGQAFVGGSILKSKVTIRFTPVMSTQIPGCILTVESDDDGGDLPWGISKVDVYVFANCLARLPSPDGTQHDGPRPRRPMFSGIAEHQQRELQQRAHGLKAGDEGLSQFEWILVALFTESEVDILRYWPSSAECSAVFLRFESVWGAALKDAAVMGNFPYYRRRAASQGLSVTSPIFRPQLAVPPPNLVTEWRVT
ncbi:hypothetical protein M409DRAFT_61283 [Zasmidium cellare ATCC 36951]|uniref:Uncharacterized protein n=1 Tax=Zasmidium cellare ATCC 36951 TaxID=1080233 RepID=A0A6A6BZ44_ZASCE|nr:uncharacterized protein M409DRAFT_61283 [Zasmidium cellare ATCC 36951]KAF2158862.1 hypothetical protein M409DRAFT_61283 [Zasmidium cellare ATCC 36951]